MKELRREILKSSSRAKQKRKLLLIKFGLIVAAILAFVGLLSWLSHNKALLIEKTIISGNEIVDTEILTSFIQQELEGKYFYLFPKRNIFIYPNARIEQDILSEFKRINYAKVSFVDTHTIRVEIRERKPFALWCGEEVIAVKDINDPCYFLDNGGFIFSRAPHFSENVYFEFYGPLRAATTTSVVGNTLLSGPEIDRIISFKNILEHIGLDAVKIHDVYIEGGQEYHLYLDTGTMIIFDQKQDMDTLFQNLSLAVAEKKKERPEDDFKNKLEYINLRFAGQVVFKFTD